jgi:beta-lactamase regulating signal transducer with metallopeptidase domain
MTIDLGPLQRLAFDALPVLLDAAVKGMVLLAAAGVLVLAMRKASAAARQVVWLLALAALLALPLASAALPSWQVLPSWARIEMPAEPAAPSLADSAGPLGGADPSGMNAAPAPLPELSQAPAVPRGYPGVLPADVAGLAPREVPGPADVAAATADAANAGKSWRTLLVPGAVAIWLAGTLVCLLPLLLGRLSLWRLARRSRRIDGGSWAMLVQRAAEAVGLRCRVVLLQSDAEPVPMVWGGLRPKLLLPAEAENWSADRRWVVLLHELAHAKRHDCLAKLIAHVACAAYWFNPLCWIASNLMQREAEAACDDLVLSTDHASTGLADLRPSDYAQHLLEIASGLKGGMLAAYSSIAMARRSKLEGRLLAILDPRRNRRALTRWGALAAATLVAGIVVPLACLKATGVNPASVPESPATQPAVKCRVRPVKDKFPFNERPRFEVALTNVSSEPIDLIATAEQPGGLPGDHYPCATLRVIKPGGGDYFQQSEDSANANPRAVRIEPGKSWSFTYPSTPNEQTFGQGPLPSLSALLPGVYTAGFCYAVRDIEKERLGGRLVYAQTAGELAGQRPEKLWEGVVYAEPVAFEVVGDDSPQLAILRDVYGGKGLDNLRLELLQMQDDARPDAQALRLRLHNTGDRSIYLGSNFGLVTRDPDGRTDPDFSGPRSGTAMQLAPKSHTDICGWSFDLAAREPGLYTVWAEYQSMGRDGKVLAKSNEIRLQVPPATQPATPAVGGRVVSADSLSDGDLGKICIVTSPFRGMGGGPIPPPGMVTIEGDQERIRGRLSAVTKDEVVLDFPPPATYGKMHIPRNAIVSVVFVPEAPPRPPAAPAAKGPFTLDLDSETVQNAVAFLQQKYPVRLCFENLDFDMEKDAITIERAIAEFEAAAKTRALTPNEARRIELARDLLRQGNPGKMLFDVGAYYSGHFEGATFDELLENLTQGTPYAWRKFQDTYIIYPAQGSLLGFKVNLDTEGLTVDQAAHKILDQQPRIAMESTWALPVRPGEDPTPWLHVKLPGMRLANLSAADALCAVTAAARPDSVWALGGYKGSRGLNLLRGPNKAAPPPPTTPPAAPASVPSGFGEKLDWEAYFRRITGTETPQDREKRAAREKQAFEDAIRKMAPDTSTVPATHQTATPPAVSIGFGPVVERVVRVPSAKNDTFLDLDTGKLLAYEDSNGPDEPTMSKELSQIYRRARWAKGSGADLCLPPDGRFDKEVTGLTGLDMRIVPTQEPFDRLTPQDAAEALADRDFYMLGEMRCAVGELPAAFLVETREGRLGVVQVAALTDQPPGLKVRYRIAAAPATVPDAPLWITLAPSEESVGSLKELEILADVWNLNQEAGRSGEWEIRTADNTRRMARLPYNWRLSPDQLLPDGKRITGGTHRTGRFRLDESQIRRVGAMEKGDYLLAWYVGGRRCSNVMRFRIDADHHPNALPLLELAEIETGPGRRLPVLVIRARRHAENDPAPRNSDVAFATLNVDGQDRTVSSMGWSGRDEPMRVGEHYTYLLDLRSWTWDPQLKQPAAPIDPDKPHVIFAKVGRDRVQQTPPIRLTYARTLGEAWDLATPKLAPAPSPEASISLSGAVVDLQGQPGRNYEVILVSADGVRFRETADGAGKYRFLRIPPGTYNLGCYPPGAGRPSLVMNGITIRADETVQVNLSFHRSIMTGVVTYADGKPGSNIDVELACKDPQSGAEFEDIATTDEQGRYTLASPFGSVTYVMVNHARAGQPDPQLQAGENRVNYTLRMQNGRFMAFPATPPAAPAAKADEPPWGEAVEGVQVRLRADKVQWKASETPKLIIDVRHQGDQKLVVRTVLDAVDELQVDGQSYRHPPENLAGVLWQPLNPGDTRLHALTVTIDKEWLAVAGKKPLALAPGKHSVRFAWQGYHQQQDKQTPFPDEAQPVRLVSNAVEIEILPSAPTSGPGLDDATKADALSPQEQKVVGVWRFSKTVYSDDGREGTELMVLNPDRTWIAAYYHGKDEIPKMFGKINFGPRWTCYQGRLQQYFPPPKGGGEHLYDRKILSVTPTTLAFEYMRKPELGPLTYNRVSRQTEVAVRNLLETAPPRAVLRGTVTGPDGKPAAGYGVSLSNSSGARFGEQTGDDGTYEFVYVPAGEYQLWANPTANGQPIVGLKSVRIEADKTLRRDLSLERKFSISGRVTFADGAPAPGREVMTTWRSADGSAEFGDFAAAGPDGRYTVSAPFETATYVGLSGTGPQPQPYHNVQAGRSDLDFVTEHPWGPAVEGVQVRLRADQMQWKAGETPTFKADVRNVGQRELFINFANWFCELEWDGQVFDQREQTGPARPFGPAQHYEDLEITLRQPWVNKKTDKPPELTAGRHTVRLAIPAGPADRGQGQSVRAVSNAVEIEILPAEGEEATSTPPAPEGPPAPPEDAEAAVQQVAGQFLSALKDKDIEAVKALSLGSVSGWVSDEQSRQPGRGQLAGLSARWLGKVIREMHEEVYPDNPDLMTRIAEVAVLHDFAAVKVPQTRVPAKYIIFIFTRTDTRWRFVTGDDARNPLAEELAARAPRVKELLGAPSAAPARGEAVGGLKCSLALKQTSLNVGDEIKVEVEFQNVSDKPISFDYPPDYAAGLLTVRDANGRPVNSTMTGVSEGWMRNKPYRTLKPGEAFKAAFDGRIAFRSVRTAGELQRPMLAMDFQRDLMRFDLVDPGRFTVELRLAGNERTTAELERLKVESPWKGALSSNAVDFQVTAATREELDAAIAMAQKGEVDQRRQAIHLLAAHADGKATSALMDTLLKGPEELRADAAAALQAIGDASVAGTLVAEYRKAGSAKQRQLLLGVLEATPDWTQQWPLYLEIAKSGATREEKEQAYDRLILVGRPEVVPVLIAAAHSGDPMSQRAAIDNISRLLENLSGILERKLPPETIATVTDDLIGLLKQDRDASVRSRAAQALGHASGDKVLTALVEALKDADAFVGSYAANSLGRIGGPEAIPALEQYVQAAPGDSQKDAGRKAIESIRTRQSAPPAAAAPAKPDDELKALRQSLARPAEYGLPKKSLPAVERLVEIGSAEAVQVLYESLRNPLVSRNIKLHALPALGRIGSKEALKAYEDFQAWAAKFPPYHPFMFGPHESPMDHFADQDLAPLVKWSAGSGQTQREFAVFRWGRYGEFWLWLVSRAPSGTWDTPGLLAMSAGDAGRIGMAEHLTGVFDAGRLVLKGDHIDLTLEPQREADDADKDGVPDALEAMLGTDPKKADSDGDGIPDGNDSNPLTPKPAQVSEDMEIRQAAFLALFGTSSTRDAANIAWAPGWDAGAKEPAEIPEWARQEYYGMGGYVLRSQRIRQGIRMGWVNITGIDINRKSATEALVTIGDYEGNAAASSHEIVVKRLGRLWVPISVRMTVIS